ncbi:MAG: NAD(P)H-dependent oxidoreductase, partial [Spirochaetaceae bacterium]|nr:NAD(P)H-dependent oxidoreductase [Spirochaetaceae bacterium]
MKIMIITGSPKPNGGTTSILVDQLKKSILSQKSDVDFVTFNIRSNFLPEDEYENLENYDALIIACPLYIDSLPSHLLTQLVKIEEYLNSKKGEKSKAKNKLQVYGLVNCGF